MALPLTCPMPTNINPLSPNGFQFSITKLPQVSYFCQEVNLPDISLGEPIQATPYVDAYIPGDKLEFAPLLVQFIIDEEMKNYTAIYNWLVGLGFPENKRQYSDWLENNDVSNSQTAEVFKGYSDAVLGILGSNNTIVKSVRFIDMFPTNLSSITFVSTSTDVQYLVGQATFRYSYFKFE
jgi:hypothetical protein